MSIILVAAIAAASPADMPITHRVAVDHGGTAVDVVYRADVATRTRQAGIAPPTRPGTERCHWTTTVVVAREVRLPGQSARTFDRPLPGERRFSGSRAGSCMTNRAAIAAEIAGKSDEIRNHVVAAAASDRLTLLAALDGARPIATD